MARIAGATRKTKEVRRDPRFMDEKHVGSEPTWADVDLKKIDEKEYDKRVRDALQYYNYFFSVKDLKKFVEAWAKQSKLFTAAELAIYTRSNNNNTPLTACGLAKSFSKGMPLNEKLATYLKDTVRTAITATNPAEPDVVEVAKPVATKPTIQDRIAEKTSATIGELEGMVDDVFFTKKPLPKVYDFLTTRQVPQAQIGKIQLVFQKQADELALAFSGKDKQLAEAYEYLTKAQIKRVNEFFTKMFEDFALFVQLKKAAKKVRKVKTPSKEKQIAKVKYMKESKELKLFSISPAEIIGAKAVWTYQAKYRRIQRYVADAHSGTLGIKGTSIVGFDEVASVGKTLRKPAEQLKAFMGIGKVALRTFLKDIRAVEIKANGRLSEDVLILRVE